MENNRRKCPRPAIKEAGTAAVAPALFITMPRRRSAGEKSCENISSVATVSVACTHSAVGGCRPASLFAAASEADPAGEDITYQIEHIVTATPHDLSNSVKTVGMKRVEKEHHGVERRQFSFSRAAYSWERSKFKRKTPVMSRAFPRGDASCAIAQPAGPMPARWGTMTSGISTHENLRRGQQR